MKNSESKNIVAIGEVLWDLLPSGARVGGAPGNLAFHAKQLGANATMISRIGNDERGRDLIAFYKSKNIETDLIAIDDQHPTGTVEVALAHGQATYTIVEDVAWDHIVASDAAVERVSLADAFCYGSLAWRSPVSRNTIRDLINQLPKHAIRFCDINLRPPFYNKDVVAEALSIATVLKLNDQELPILAEMFVGTDGQIEEQVWRLMQHFGCSMVILTCGENGSLLRTREATSWLPGVPVSVVDTVGAGDAFAAAVLVKHLSGWSLEATHGFASLLAAAVCQQDGATPIFTATEIADWERESRGV